MLSKVAMSAHLHVPRKFITAKRLVTMGAVLTIGSMLIIASISYRTTESYLSSKGIGSSRLQLIQNVLSNLKDAEAAHHGFLLTGNPTYLDSYNEARLEVNQNIARLRALAKQIDFTEANELNDMREMVNAKLAELGNSLEIRRNSGLEPAIESVVSGDKENSLERIRKFIMSIQEDELERQADVARADKASAAFHQHLTLGLVAIDALFLLAVGLLGWKINRLEHLVTVCAWSQKVEYEGEWMRFEEFLEKRFGIRCSHGISEEEAKKWFVPELPTDATDININDESALA